MISNFIRSLCVLMAVSASAACARMTDGATTVPFPADGTRCDNFYEPGIELPTASGPGAPVDMRSIVRNENAADVLKDSVKLNAALDAMGATPGAPLPNKINSVRNSHFGRGQGGISVRSFLQAAEDTPPNSDNEFESKGRLKAYYFDQTGAKKSCLQVEMTTLTRRGNSGIWKPVVFRWHVFADFQVAPKVDSGPGFNPADVFPNADTVPISITTASGFSHKLWARSDALKVTLAEKKLGAGSFSPLPPPFYQPAAGSCIDMMFAGYPPEKLPSTASPPFYCLGRCKYPPIINTK